MDCSIPQTDGFALAKEILKINPTQMIVAMTTEVEYGFAQRCHKAGMREFICKPV